MQFGRFVGIMFLFIGGFLTAFFDTMYRDGSYIKILMAGPALVLVGLAMLFFPGGNITLEESKNHQKEPGIFVEEAPMAHKIAWGVALFAGVALALNWNIFL